MGIEISLPIRLFSGIHSSWMVWSEMWIISWLRGTAAANSQALDILHCSSEYFRNEIPIFFFCIFFMILIKLSDAWNITQNRYRVILFISSFSIYFWLLSSNKYNRISLKFRPTRFTYMDYGSLLPKIIESVQNSSNSHRHRQRPQQLFA